MGGAQDIVRIEFSPLQILRDFVVRLSVTVQVTWSPGRHWVTATKLVVVTGVRVLVHEEIPLDVRIGTLDPGTKYPPRVQE